MSDKKKLSKGVRVISISAQKGGVGKTTSCANLAVSLTKLGYKVLVVDMNPTQGNLTRIFLGQVWEAKEPLNGIYGVVSGEVDLRDAVYKTGKENLWIVPAEFRGNIDSVISEDISTMPFLKVALKNFDGINDLFDFVIIDNTPTLGMGLVASYIASDYFLMPIEISDFSIESIAESFKMAYKSRDGYNPNLKSLGIFVNKLDARTSASKESLEELEIITEKSGIKLFNAKIPTLATFNSLPRINATIHDVSRPTSRGHKEYNQLASEVVNRIIELESEEENRGESASFANTNKGPSVNRAESSLQ